MLQASDWFGHRYVRRGSGSLLSAAVRRDVADLNRQFLGLAGAPGTPVDLGCAHVPLELSALDGEELDAMAACPFTLFEIRLPEAPAGPIPAEPQVRDEQRMPVSEAEIQWQVLAHGALTLAWQLADRSPVSLRLALGLSLAAELLLNETRVTGLAAWARRPGLLRTRWFDHPVFWVSLAEACRRRDAVALSRAHCLGLTLLVADLDVREPDRSSRPGGSRARR